MHARSIVELYAQSIVKPQEDHTLQKVAGSISIIDACFTGMLSSSCLIPSQGAEPDPFTL